MNNQELFQLQSEALIAQRELTDSIRAQNEILENRQRRLDGYVKTPSRILHHFIPKDPFNNTASDPFEFVYRGPEFCKIIVQLNGWDVANDVPQNYSLDEFTYDKYTVEIGAQETDTIKNLSLFTIGNPIFNNTNSSTVSRFNIDFIGKFFKLNITALGVGFPSVIVFGE